MQTNQRLGTSTIVARDIDSWSGPLTAALALAQVIARTANETPGALRLEPETLHLLQIALDAVNEDIRFNRGVLWYVPESEGKHCIPPTN